MAIPTIDRWLRGLEDLTELDPDELGSRLAALRADVQMMQLKIGVLEQLLAEAKRRAPRDQLEQDPRPNETAEANSDREGRNPMWKRDAVLVFLRQHPHHMFRPMEIRQALRDQGIMSGDDGTPTPLLLRRMTKSNQVVHDDGRYGYKPSEVSPYQRSLATQNGEP